MTRSPYVPRNLTGGAAFPRPARASIDDGFSDGDEGMTLRDYFAGQALAALAPGAEDWEGVAAAAYAAADAMIAARAWGGR